jgi:hypothetical protein
MTKTLFNLPNILNYRVGLQENHPLSPYYCLISSLYLLIMKIPIVSQTFHTTLIRTIPIRYLSYSG